MVIENDLGKGVCRTDNHGIVKQTKSRSHQRLKDMFKSGIGHVSRTGIHLIISEDPPSQYDLTTWESFCSTLTLTREVI